MSAVAETPAGVGASTNRSLVGRVAAEPWLIVLVIVTAALDAAASIIRHVHLASGLDLAIFDQAVWHYSHFQAPFSSIKGEDLLGDHFHPLVAILAPLYWIWSDPRMLLIAQAILVAASIVPVFVFAKDRVGRGGGYMLAVAYAAFWGLQVGVLFEFHEVAFAPLLVALAILLADRQQWRFFWLVIALILCVKEDLSFFVIFFGIYLLTLRQFRHGTVLIVVGAGWYELVTRVLIPHFAGGAVFAYWTYGALGKTPLEALWGIVRAPWRLVTIGLTPSQKARTLAALFMPFLFLSLGSRLIILAIPLLAERFLSTNQDFWSTHFHYSLAIAPVLAMSAAAGLANVAQFLDPRRRAIAIALGAAAMLVASVTITLAGTSDSALSKMTRASFYDTPSYVSAAYRALGHVPRSASLATTDAALPHASERDHIELLGPSSVQDSQYILVDALHIRCCGDTGNVSYAALGQALDAELPRMTPVYYDSGWLVARAPGPGAAPSNGTLKPLNAGEARVVGSQVARWRKAIAGTYGRLLSCYRLLAAHDQHAENCVKLASRGAERSLSTAIRPAVQTAVGGCAQLGNEAAIVSDQLDSYVLRIAAAAQRSDPSAVIDAFRAFQTYVRGTDPFGLITRFTILCSPR